MNIQTLQLTDLKPLEVNVRKHTETQIKELIRSLEQFGQTRAIVIDEDNNILIGNGLHEAMTRVGMKDAAVYRKSGLSDIEKKKLILADNKTYSLGSDDYENIETYLAEITSTGDFDVAGFSEDVLRNLMRDAEEVLQDVQSYGVLTPETVQTKQTKQVVDTGNPVTEETQEEAPPEPAAVNTILCPSCGECIPLD